MQTVTYSVPNISCNHCVNTIQNEVSEVEGVKTVLANADNKSVVITFETPASEQAIMDTLKAINYPVAE